MDSRYGLVVALFCLTPPPLGFSALIAFATIEIFAPRGLGLEVMQMDREVETQTIILQDTLKVLLHEAIPPAEIEELLSNPESPKWKSPELDEALEQVLGESAYEVLIRDLQSLLETLRSLEQSICVITKNQENYFWLSHRGRKLVLMQNETRQALEDLRCRNLDLQSLACRSTQTPLARRSTHARRERYARQALQNIDDILEKFRYLQRVTHNVEAIVTGEVIIPVDSDSDDALSLCSVETEAGREGEAATLSFLALSIEAANGATPRLKRDALLDTGATACAISISLARELRLDIEEDGQEREVRTAALNQTLRIAGKARVKMRWKDSDGIRCGTKIWVYVVYGLCQAVLLSHDFTQNHPEVWSVARKVIRSAQELQVLWFKKRSAEDQKTQQELRAKRLEENRARADAASSRASSSRAAGSTQSQGSSSSAASVLGLLSTLAAPSVAQSAKNRE